MSEDAVGVVFAKALTKREACMVMIATAPNVVLPSGNAVVIAQRDVKVSKYIFFLQGNLLVASHA